MDFKVFCYIQPAHMTTMQHSNDLYARTCKVAVVYYDSTPKNIFIKGVDPSICRSLKEHYATHPLSDVTDIAYKAQSLLPIQKGATKPAITNNQATCNKMYGKGT